MSTQASQAQYDFLSYVRIGVAASLTAADPLTGDLPARGALSAALTVQAQPIDPTRPPATLTQQVSMPVQLYGPGDVVGIAPEQIVRTEPRAGTLSFEPNYFAAVEFDQLDFPWRYTPAAPTLRSTTEPGGRLRPWLCLIVLTAAEFSDVPGQQHPLPAITVTDPTALPDLDESWAWAHVQVAGGAVAGAMDLAAQIASAPGLAGARMFCLRKLVADAIYTAMLVPAFEAGRLAGLGQDAPRGAGATTAPAWSASTPPGLQLPVYYRFSFGTGAGGDFETLLRLLQPGPLPITVGQLTLDVSDPGWGLPDAGGPLELGGALGPLDPPPATWPDAAKQQSFQDALRTLVNQTGPGTDDPEHPNCEDPVIVPPLYGHWLAAQPSLDPPPSAPSPLPWLTDLNLEILNRVPAGLGTQVVHKYRSQLLASAWEQVEGIHQINQQRRQAQLARATLAAVHLKHLQSASPETLLLLTSPVQSRLLDMTTAPARQTVRAALGQSRIPVRAVSPAFRRVSRPLGGPASRQVTGTPRSAGSIIQYLNSDAAVAASLPVPAPATLDAVSAGVTRALGQPAAKMRFANLTPSMFASVATAVPGRLVPITRAGGQTMDAQAFSAAASRVAAYLQAPASDPPPAPAANVASLRSTLLQRLDPDTTVATRLSTQVVVAGTAAGGASQAGDELEPLLWEPTFPQPMFQPLADLSQEFVLPGLRTMPPNTVTLVEPNRAFIESYLVGLNHEMARQLLWDLFPTDQLCTYFQHFWNTTGFLPGPIDPPDLADHLQDIVPIHTWSRQSQLGQHEPPRGTVATPLVLVIRWLGFLLYPQTTVYACQAQWDAVSGTRVLGTTEMQPLFRGSLPPDVTFFGFNLSETEARGAKDPSRDAGWFFVFQQDIAGPRFGLEPAPDPYRVGAVTQWRDLSWANFAASAAELAQLRFLSVKQQTLGVTIAPGDGERDAPPAAWGPTLDAGQVAGITLRLPFRAAIHADLMLPDTSPAS